MYITRIDYQHHYVRERFTRTAVVESYLDRDDCPFTVYRVYIGTQNSSTAMSH